MDADRPIDPLHALARAASLDTTRLLHATRRFRFGGGYIYINNRAEQNRQIG
jgi:hypothetical protein